jgi:hypothetical protein
MILKVESFNQEEIKFIVQKLLDIGVFVTSVSQQKDSLTLVLKRKASR